VNFGNFCGSRWKTEEEIPKTLHKAARAAGGSGAGLLTDRGDRTTAGKIYRGTINVNVGFVASNWWGGGLKYR
jgi:hypothetical protein